jgi:hypothetical protein
MKKLALALALAMSPIAVRAQSTPNMLPPGHVAVPSIAIRDLSMYLAQDAAKIQAAAVLMKEFDDAVGAKPQGCPVPAQEPAKP